MEEAKVCELNGVHFQIANISISEQEQEVESPPRPLKFVDFLKEKYKDCFLFDDLKIFQDEEENGKEIASRFILNYRWGNISKDKELTMKCLEWIPIDTIVWNLLLSLAHFILEEYEKGRHVLRQTSELISTAANDEHKLITEEHAEGLQYLVRSLFALDLVLKSIRAEEKDELCLPVIGEEDKDFFEDTMTYDQIPVKGRVAVEGARIIFSARFLQYHRKSEETEEKLRNLVSLDPDTLDWRLMYHSELRSRSGVLRVQEPSEKERKSMENLLELNGDKDNVMVKYALCKFLCGIVYCKQWKPCEGPFKLSTLSFNSEEEIIELVKEKSREMLAAAPKLAKVCWGVADFATKLVPQKYRDAGFAKECLAQALNFRPNCSKSNHKMAQHLLNYEIGRQDEALEYCQKAYEFDKDNSFALIDILNLKLRDPGKYREELVEEFERAINLENGRNSRERGSIIFARGIFHFMRNELESFVKDWEMSFKIDADNALKTAQLIANDFLINRYGWRVQPQRLRQLAKTLTKKLEVVVISDETDFAKIIWCSLEEATMKDPQGLLRGPNKPALVPPSRVSEKFQVSRKNRNKDRMMAWNASTDSNWRGEQGRQKPAQF